MLAEAFGNKLCSYQALAVASQGVRSRPAALVLAVCGLYHRDKASVQKALLCSANCADNADRPGHPVFDGDLQPLCGIQSPQWTDTQPLHLRVCGL